MRQSFVWWTSALDDADLPVCCLQTWAASLYCLNAFLVDGVLFLSWLQSFGSTLAFLQCFLVVTGHSNFLKAVLKIFSPLWRMEGNNICSHDSALDITVILTGSLQAVILLASAAASSLNIYILSLLSSCLLKGKEAVSLSYSPRGLLWCLPFQEELWVKDWAVTQVSFALGLARCVSCVFLSRGPGKWSETEPSPVWENDNGIFSVS